MTYPNIPTAAVATAIQQIVDELGSNPRGSAATLTARLAAMDSTESLKGFGTGTITAGAGATPVNIAHGLAFTPDIKKIRITPTAPLKTATQWALTAVDATNITIGLYNTAGTGTNQTGTDFTFTWAVEE
jgi:hypothetical protein